MDRLQTGIIGFDDLVGKGIPRGSTIVLSGSPGAGKTCLSVSYLLKGIEMGESGIFCSFNENQSELIETQKSFGYDLKKYIKKKKLTIMDFSSGRPLGGGQIMLSSQGKLDLPSLIKHIKDEIDEISAKRLVIDPLTIIPLLFDDPREARYNTLRFFDMIRRFKVTTFAIAEWESKGYSVEEYLAHGVIRLYNTKEGSTRQRGIEIIKLRGVQHRNGVYPYRLTDDGIVILPNIKLPG